MHERNEQMYHESGSQQRIRKIGKDRVEVHMECDVECGGKRREEEGRKNLRRSGRALK